MDNEDFSLNINIFRDLGWIISNPPLGLKFCESKLDPVSNLISNKCIEYFLSFPPFLGINFLILNSGFMHIIVQSQ